MARPSLSFMVAALAVVATAATTGCTGGCYDQAGPVSTLPAASCLTLYGGQSATDPTVCASPDLGGRNGCDSTLTLPAHTSAGAPIAFAPGASIVYPIPGSGPGVTVSDRGSGVRDYIVDGTLGSDAITITFTVRRD